MKGGDPRCPGGFWSPNAGTCLPSGTNKPKSVNPLYVRDQPNGAGIWTGPRRY